MGFAFWRRKQRSAGVAKPVARVPLSEDSPDKVDATAALRLRARRRFIGAAALLLAVVVIVPMLLDPEPRELPDNIPIEIPSERTPFAPRLSLPTPPQTPQPVTIAPVAPPPAAGVKPEPRADAPQSDAARTVPPRIEPAEEQRALSLLEGKAAAALPPVAKAGRFSVQVAAPANEGAARELAERLRRAGFTTYIEPVEVKDGTRHRVRVGPYASRSDGERALAALKPLGFSGNLVAH